MAKTQRIGLVQVDADAPTRSPEREALAIAIENHTALKQSIAENVVNARNTEEVRWASHRAFDLATKALETAAEGDAHALAQGQPGGAVKAARMQVQDAADTLDAAKAAEKMLVEQKAELQQRLGISASSVNQAIEAVVNNAPEVRALIERFSATQLAYHDAHEGMRALATVLPSPTNGAAWAATGLPREARFWDNVAWEQALPPSPTAARVKVWLEQLRSNANAVLE